MKNNSTDHRLLLLILMVVIFFSISVFASHDFSGNTDISTTGSDKWTEAEGTETVTITINVSGDYLNQINITVPSSGANYSVNWSTLSLSHINWTCINETVSDNVSKIICGTTPGNETRDIDISFDATAFTLNDSYQNWTIATMDNNSGTNTTYLISVVGISPYLFDPKPPSGGWTKALSETFSINITELNLDNASGKIFYHQSGAPTWDNSTLTCYDNTTYYFCNSSVNLGSWTEATIDYYFTINDTYNGIGYSGTPSSPLYIDVDRNSPNITVDFPTNNTWYNNIMNFTLTVTDSGIGVDSVYFNLSNQSWSNYTQMLNSTPTIFDIIINTSEYEEELYDLNFTSDDLLGNLNYTDGYIIGFDNTPPSVSSLEYPNAGMMISGIATLRALVKDNASGIQNVSFYNITETLDGGGNITGIQWNFLGSNTTGNATAGYDHNWTFDWNTSAHPDENYYLAINVTDKVHDTPNYNQSASLEIAAQNGNDSNSSGGIFVQVRNIDPAITFHTPRNSTTNPPLSAVVEVTFIIEHITEVNISTIQLNITNTSSTYSLHEFNATEDCLNTTYINNSYFDMTFYKYNCTTDWNTAYGGENGTELNDSILNLTASAHTISIDTSSTYLPSKSATTTMVVDVNNSGAPPVIHLMQPLNPYFPPNQTIDFVFYVTDNENTAINCTLYIDNVLQDTNNSVFVGSLTENVTILKSNSTISGIGAHPYMINCTDQKLNKGNHTSSIFIIPEDETVYKEIPYMIIMPSQYSPYYDASFNALGIDLNATINNNSYSYTASVDQPHYYSIPQRADILYFDDDNLNSATNNSLADNIRVLDGRYVTVIMHPQHVTPNMIRTLGDVFKAVNDNPYTDVSWGIVTAKTAANAEYLIDRSLGTVSLNQTTYYNYYEPDTVRFTKSSAFAPLEQAYQAAATFITTILNSAGSSTLYAGTSATNTNMFGRLDNTEDSNILYFAGGGTNEKLYVNETDYNDINADYNKCPFFCSINNTVECHGVADFTSFKNNLILFSTSDYLARISSNDTNPSAWDVNNGVAGNWSYSDSLIIQMLYKGQMSEGPVAFISSTSVSWITSEVMAKSFFLHLLESMDMGSALASTKNTLMLNRENVIDSTTKNFLSHLDDSYVLYGIPQTDSPVNTGYIDYTENPVQIDANPSTGDPISWNSTVSVSPRSTVPALYSGGLWQSTQGVVWYQNVTAPSGGKINIKFLAALAGEYYPDPAAYDLSAQVSVSSPSFTQMSVNIERTEIIPSSPSSEQYNQSTTFLFSASVSQDDFIYDIKDNRSILFAIPYSPNGNILSSYSKTISLTFKTDEVTIETLSVKGKSVGTGLPENEITVIFDLVNPTNLTISNLAIKYPIPSLTSSCSVSGSYSGSCVSSSGFALQNISQVLPGRTQYTLNYITDANMTNTNEIYYDYLPTPRTDKSVFNWGDNVTLKSDIKSSSSFDAEIFTEVILLKNTGNLSQTPVSENSIVWSDRTTATLNSSGNIIKPVWQIPVNTSTSQPGEYLLKIYALENATSKYLLKNIVYVNLTDELNLTITATDISSETADGIPEGNFNFSFSGSVKKQTGASLNGTIIGPSVYVYLNAVEVSGSPWSVTSGGQLQNIVVKNIDPGIGSHTFKIEVLDEFNNSGIYLYHFNVTNTVESITVLVNNSDTFTANEEDWVKISGIIYGNGSKKVYDADVTVNAGIETICTTKSDMAGAYSCDWQVPYGKDVSAYTISVEAISPLNTTKTVTNSTSLKVVWLDVTIDPQISDIGVTSSSGFSKSVTAEGDVRYSRDMTNISLVENAAVTCFIKDTKGWNNSHDVLVSAAGNYTCIFSSGLNHTGNYFVKISAEHNIENITEPVRGYKEQSFKIIDTSDDSSGSSPSSTTVPIVSIPQTTTTEMTANFNFNYNDTIEIEQGSDKIISIIVTNIGDGTLNNVSISLSGLSSISWNVITSQPITVFEPNVSAVFNINISVPYDAQVSDYNVSATVTAQQDIDESIEFQLLILPSVKSVEDMQKYFNDTEDIISGYNDRLDYLFVEFSDQNILQKLLKPLNSTKIADVKFKIHEAKKLLKESMGLFEAGNNIEAFKTKHQADNLIQEIEAMLKEEELKMSQWLKLRNIFIIMGLFMLALLLFTGYMLLPPIKTKYAPKDEFFQQKIKKPFLASLSLKLKNITGRVSSNKDGKMSGQKKYDVSGKDKIDTLNEEFKKHLKDED